MSMKSVLVYINNLYVHAVYIRFVGKKRGHFISNSDPLTNNYELYFLFALFLMEEIIIILSP